MAIFRLDFRPVFRALGKRDRDAYAEAVAGAAASSPGRGGSIVAALRRLPVKVRRWGYVLPIATIGQKLTWLLRGTTGQPARPATYDDEPPAQELAQALEARALEQLSRYDREAR